MSGVGHKGERHIFALVGFTMKSIGDSLTPQEWQRSAPGFPRWDSVQGAQKNAHHHPAFSFIVH